MFWTFWFRLSGFWFRVSGFGVRVSGWAPKADLALFGELDAIGQKVEENLPEPVRIADHVLGGERRMMLD